MIRKITIPKWCMPILILIIITCGCSRSIPTPVKSYYETGDTPYTQRPYTVFDKTYYPINNSSGFRQTGLASWYGLDFHGKKTSNGEIYNTYALTAAHKTLPMDTYVLVENLNNQKQVVVRINDRGPFVKGRIIDLSFNAAKKIGIIENGTGNVLITALTTNKQDNTPASYKQKVFTIQVGSFSKIENARYLVEKLKNMDYMARIESFSSSNNLTFYRIRVNQFKNIKNAEKHVERLVQDGFTEAMVVVN